MASGGAGFKSLLGHVRHGGLSVVTQTVGVTTAPASERGREDRALTQAAGTRLLLTVMWGAHSGLGPLTPPAPR